MNVDGTYDGSAGNDTFTVAGTVSGGGNIDLGDGDDTLTLQDGAALNAAVSGGAGRTDSVVLDNANALTFDGTNVADFEDLTKQNTGTATLTGVHSLRQHGDRRRHARRRRHAQTPAFASPMARR